MLNITATAVAGISLVSASNEEMPCLTALKLTNDSDEAISNVKAVISFEPEIADAKTVTFSYVEAHATAFASPLALRHFRFDPAFFFTIDKKTEGKIAIKVYRESDAQNPIAETDVPIEILPYDAWGGIGYLKYSHLAAFVNPQMEAIKRLAGYADDILKKTKGKSLDAYQGDSGDVVNQIGAAFEAIHEQKIFTTDMPVPYNDTAKSK